MQLPPLQLPPPPYPLQNEMQISHQCLQVLKFLLSYFIKSYILPLIPKPPLYKKILFILWGFEGRKNQKCVTPPAFLGCDYMTHDLITCGNIKFQLSRNWVKMVVCLFMFRFEFVFWPPCIALLHDHFLLMTLNSYDEVCPISGPAYWLVQKMMIDRYWSLTIPSIARSSTDDSFLLYLGGYLLKWTRLYRHKWFDTLWFVKKNEHC